jgi:type I restriction enzyme S subunit
VELPHQKKIAKILSTVDAVIEKTESAIAKYQAIKQGLMHDLFTRGIDVNTGKLRPTPQDVPDLYKESALGLIPRSWEVEELGNLCSENLKYGINAAAVEFNNNLPIYIRITDIDENGNFSEKGRKSVDNPYSNQYYLKKGDIVFARTGATVGKTYLYKENDGRLVYAGFLIKASSNPNLLNPAFLKYYAETNYYLNWVIIMSQRSGQPGINGNEYASLKIPKANIKEQNLIASKLGIIQTKIQTEQQALAKYQQLKAGLLQDLLTGKVAVSLD